MSWATAPESNTINTRVPAAAKSRSIWGNWIASGALMTNAMMEQISDGAPLGPFSGSIAAGDVIDGKYLVGECIAWGGMGIVTEATHLHLQKAVALKCVRPEFLDNEEMVARFLNEARIAANLRNEHVARVLDFGKTDAGVPYLVMERVEGMSLGALVLERGPLAVSQAAHSPPPPRQAPPPPPPPTPLPPATQPH